MKHHANRHGEGESQPASTFARRESNNTEKGITSTFNQFVTVCASLEAHLIHVKAISRKTAGWDKY